MSAVPKPRPAPWHQVPAPLPGDFDYEAGPALGPGPLDIIPAEVWPSIRGNYLRPPVLPHGTLAEVEQQADELARLRTVPGLDSPYWPERKAAQQEQRRRDAARTRECSALFATYAAQLDRTAIKAALDEHLGAMPARVERESIIAGYLLRVHEVFPEERFGSLALRMESCHRGGVAGITPEGAHVIAWDQKCDNMRLCPHAAYKETKRLVEAYVAGILEQRDRHPLRRMFYIVLNPANVPEGQLAAGKARVFDQTKAWLRHDAEACPLILNEKTGRWRRTKPFSMADCIQGALVVQEDPLGTSSGWNVHNNLLVITEGQFDYGLARAWWNEIVHGTRIDPRRSDHKAFAGFNPVDPDNLVRTMFEIIKYTIATVVDKSLDQETAPPLTEWHPALFLEWWKANRGFRRTRSYGCLYAIDRKRWDPCDPQSRYDLFFQPARERGFFDLPLEYVSRTWCSIPEADRAKLRRAMRQPNPLHLDTVRWVGQVVYVEAWASYYVDLADPAAYSVASLPGDNFSGFAGAQNKSGAAPPESTHRTVTLP